MNPTSRYKQWIKEWKECLEKSPGHPRLEKWIKDATKDLSEWRKQRNSNGQYMRFHKAYNLIGINDKDGG